MFGKIPLTSRYRLDTGLLIDVPGICDRSFLKGPLRLVQSRPSVMVDGGACPLPAVVIERRAGLTCDDQHVVLAACRPTKTGRPDERPPRGVSVLRWRLCAPTPSQPQQVGRGKGERGRFGYRNDFVGTDIREPNLVELERSGVGRVGHLLPTCC